MATGTSGGLLDSSDEHAQSVFKHEILRQYLPPFAAMTGLRSPGNRVVVLDGFAGNGRYPDGRPGSAEILLQVAETLRTRLIEAFFVEKERPHFRSLASVVDEYIKRGVTAKAWHGDVGDHINEVVQHAIDLPLFLFLDPCGANLPFATLAQILSGARRNERPATEVLLNFSADLTRRTAGVLKAGQLDQPSIRRMDLTCGGEWWRQVVLSAHASSPHGTFERAAELVATGYASRLGNASGMHTITVPVRRRLHHQPIYHLVFLTRASHGIWVFGDALAKARQAWLRHLGPQDGDEDGLFSLGDVMEAVISAEQERAERQIRANLRRLVGTYRQVKLVAKAAEVFGEAYGVATESTVRKALRAMERAGEITLAVTAPQLRDWIVGRPSGTVES